MRVDVWDYKGEDKLFMKANEPSSGQVFNHAQVLDILDTNNDRILNGKDAADGAFEGWGVHKQNTDLVLEVSNTEVVLHGVASGTFDFLS